MSRPDRAARPDAPPESPPDVLSRRRVVQLGILGALSLAVGSRLARATSAMAASGEASGDASGDGAAAAALCGPRRLRMLNTHTLERLDLCYHDGSQLVPDALAEVNRVLRDHRSNEVHPIAPAVLDIAWALSAAVGKQGAEYEIISGYRSHQTNEQLRAAHGGVAARSLHCEGRAIDLRIAGFDTARLRDAALAMKRGGVGYYHDSDFVHVDDGRVRRW